MTVAYYSTKDLCERLRCSSRTLFRRMKRKVNPLPPPCIRGLGSCNLWDADEVAAWELRERERTRDGDSSLAPAPRTTVACVDPVA